MEKERHSLALKVDDPQCGLRISDLSLQESVLAQAMVAHSQKSKPKEEVYAMTTGYSPHGRRRIHNIEIGDEELESLRKQFEKDPKTPQAIARNNLIAIARDKRLGESERRQRLERYLLAYTDLIVKLDKSIFPETPDGAAPQEGVPEYLPDGLSDMGSDPSIDPRYRSREKIRIMKKEITSEMMPELLDMLMKLGESELYPEKGDHNERIKQYIVTYISSVVRNKLKYDFKGEAKIPKGGSVRADEIFKGGLGVCRHHAIYGQVLFQMMGITSRLLKCDVDFGDTKGPHGSGIVRINHKLYLIDITNPEKVPSKEQATVFLKPIPDKDISAIPDGREWKFNPKDGKARKYKKRSNMYFRIRRDKI